MIRTKIGTSTFYAKLVNKTVELRTTPHVSTVFRSEKQARARYKTVCRYEPDYKWRIVRCLKVVTIHERPLR